MKQKVQHKKGIIPSFHLNVTSSRKFDNNKHFVHCKMEYEERATYYLERLLVKLDEIDKMPSPLKKMQAKIDLRRLFEEALREGKENAQEKPGTSSRKRRIHVRKLRPLYRPFKDLADFN